MDYLRNTLFPKDKSLLCLLSLRSTKSVAPKLFRARPKSGSVVFAFHNLGAPHSYLPRAPQSLNPPLGLSNYLILMAIVLLALLKQAFFFIYSCLQPRYENKSHCSVLNSRVLYSKKSKSKSTAALQLPLVFLVT